MKKIKIVQPSVWFCPIDGEAINAALEKIEWAGRTCYKSEDRVTADSSINFTRTTIESGHLSVIEHVNVTVKIVCDRGVTHELVRHRVGSYSQESTRYCNYEKKGIVFVKPLFFPHIPIGEFDTLNDLIERSYGELETRELRWADSMFMAALNYSDMLALGCSPEQARSVLPNSLKTEIVVTYNLRQWRHFLKLRYFGTTGKPHPQMVEVAEMIYREFKNLIPTVFDNLEPTKSHGRIAGVTC